ncbi:MAG: hypothetical protein QXD44_08575 [Candidatus Nezhaarchaeales archaeon]
MGWLLSKCLNTSPLVVIVEVMINGKRLRHTRRSAVVQKTRTLGVERPSKQVGRGRV